MSDAESRRARKLQTCKYFNGIQNECCELGINYEALRNESVRPFLYPCLNTSSPVVCEKKELYTKQEVDEHEQQMIETLARTMRARQAIVDATDGVRGVAGSIDCPECSKPLHYQVHTNGHIWATCTGGCVSWIE